MLWKATLTVKTKTKTFTQIFIVDGDSRAHAELNLPRNWEGSTVEEVSLELWEQPYFRVFVGEKGS